MPKNKKIKIATFNVNSIRTRLPLVLDWLDKTKTDILCIQETKVADDLFPVQDFTDAGYHAIYHGQKAYNGVAIISKAKPGEYDYGLHDKPEPDQARLIYAKLHGIWIINTYVPQGRDIETEYFQYKLEWLRRLKRFFEKKFTPRQKVLWCGDINTAPTEIDVHNPKRLKGHVCFNDELIEVLNDVTSWGFIDVFRKHHPDEDGLYSWFDYRTRGSVERNLGWRVDLIYATKSLASKCTDSYIDLEPRKSERPSDHAPVVAEFDL